jgi:hypothetical protein
VVLVNKIRTPDGTVLISRSEFDYQQHKDSKTGNIYAVDGGLERPLRSPWPDLEDLSVQDDGTIETAREHLEWYISSGDFFRPSTSGYCKLKNISDKELEEILNRIKNSYYGASLSGMHLRYFNKEAEFRLKHDIKVATTIFGEEVLRAPMRTITAIIAGGAEAMVLPT